MCHSVVYLVIYLLSRQYVFESTNSILFNIFYRKWISESHSVVSDSLRSHGLYCPWNSPGQNTGVGSLSLLQGIFPTQGSNSGLLHCRQILYLLNHQGSPRNSGMALWGPCCSRGVRTDSRFPCLLHEVGQLHSLQGLRVGVCPGVRLEERLRLLAQPFGGILCRGHVQYPALAPDTLFLLQALQKGQLVFLFFLYHVIRNFPQQSMHKVILSPSQFLCILFLKETCA